MPKAIPKSEALRYVVEEVRVTFRRCLWIVVVLITFSAIAWASDESDAADQSSGKGQPAPSVKAMELTAENFQQELVGYKSIALVHFHAHSSDKKENVAALFNELDVLATKYAGLVLVGHVNCTGVSISGLK